MDGHFYTEERYKLVFNLQNEKMDWDLERVNNKLQLERENMDLEKHEAYVKWEPGPVKRFWGPRANLEAGVP